MFVKGVEKKKLIEFFFWSKEEIIKLYVQILPVEKNNDCFWLLIAQFWLCLSEGKQFCLIIENILLSILVFTCFLWGAKFRPSGGFIFNLPQFWFLALAVQTQLTFISTVRKHVLHCQSSIFLSLVRYRTLDDEPENLTELGKRFLSLLIRMNMLQTTGKMLKNFLVHKLQIRSGLVHF